MHDKTFGGRQAVAILLASIAIYCFYYLSHSALPANNPEYPAGWWGWFDQGQYLRSALAFSRGDFRPENHYYPPLYPVLGALFVEKLPAHPYFFVNGLAFALFTHGFMVVARRHLNFACALLLLAASVYLNRPVMENFAIPWTTACTIAAVGAAVLLLVRLDRMPSLMPGRVAGMALALSIAFGLLALARPLDALLAGVFFPAFVWRTWRHTARSGGPAARLARTAPACAMLLVGPVASAAIFLAFNDRVFGNPFGGYFSATASASGYFPAEFLRKSVALLIDSYSLYLEPRASLLSHYPWLVLSAAGMVLAFRYGDFLLRAIALAVVLQFSLYIPYGDLLPNGLWRYKNIHYFKWTLPFLALYAALAIHWTLQAARTRGRRGLAIVGGTTLLVALLACSPSISTRTVPSEGRVDADRTVHLPLAGGRTDFVDLPGFQGSFAAVYFGEHRVLLDGRPLQKVRDFRLLPGPGGVRLLFNRTMEGAVLELQPDPAVVVPPSPVTASQGVYRLGLGRPRLRHD